MTKLPQLKRVGLLTKRLLSTNKACNLKSVGIARSSETKNQFLNKRKCDSMAVLRATTKRFVSYKLHSKILILKWTSWTTCSTKTRITKRSWLTTIKISSTSLSKSLKNLKTKASSWRTKFHNLKNRRLKFYQKLCRQNDRFYFGSARFSLKRTCRTH
jgi:hypothetical protein